MITNNTNYTNTNFKGAFCRETPLTWRIMSDNNWSCGYMMKVLNDAKDVVVLKVTSGENKIDMKSISGIVDYYKTIFTNNPIVLTGAEAMIYKKGIEKQPAQEVLAKLLKGWVNFLDTPKIEEVKNHETIKQLLNDSL